jgi:hypothetical protein
MRHEQEEVELALAISASLAEQEQKEQRDRLAAAELVAIRTVVRERTNASPAQSSMALAPQSSAPLASEPPPQRYAIGSSVYVKRSDGEEPLAYVKGYDAEKALYTVELERFGSGKGKTCSDKDLRAVDMVEGFQYSA